MKKKHHIKKYYLYFQLFLVHWRLRWAISAKARRLKIKLFEKNDWRVLAHEIDWVGVFHQVFHWHISPEQAWLILFWYGNTKVCYWTIHILDLIVPKHPDINDKWKNYWSSRLFAHLTIWPSDNLTIWPTKKRSPYKQRKANTTFVKSMVLLIVFIYYKNH